MSQWRARCRSSSHSICEHGDIRAREESADEAPAHLAKILVSVKNVARDLGRRGDDNWWGLDGRRCSSYPTAAANSGTVGALGRSKDVASTTYSSLTCDMVDDRSHMGREERGLVGRKVDAVIAIAIRGVGDRKRNGK
jgi:hypothetical protein